MASSTPLPAAVVAAGSTIDIQTIAVVAPEGGSGATPFVFTVTRSGDTGSAASVAWSVPVYSTPYANALDFVGSVLPSGTISFASGQVTQTLTVMVQGDALPETDEQFYVNLASPSGGAVLGHAVGTGQILNDEFTGTIIHAVNGSLQLFGGIAYALEGDSGATPFVYALQRAGDLSAAASVDWSVAGSGARPANAADFVGGALPSGTASFAAGQALAYVTVEVQGDTTAEPGSEDFTVSLSNPVGTTIFDPASATGRIGNDDLPPGGVVGLSGTVDQAEGTGGATPFVFTVDRQGDTSIAATVTWVVQGVSLYNPATGLNASAADATDFIGAVLPSGTISFATGQTSQSITVNVAGDSVYESDEAFGVTLTGATGTTLGTEYGLPTAVSGIIRNDDAYAIIQRISPGLIYEGNTDSHPVNYLVTVIGHHSEAAVITWTLVPDGANPVDAADFAGGVLPSGTLTFAGISGSVGPNQTIAIAIAGDTIVEPNEGFRIVLASTSPGITIGDPIAADTITNDDRTVSVTALDAAKVEGNSGSTAFTFTIARTGISAEPNTSQQVSWSVGGYGATPVNAADFLGSVVPSGTVTFGPGILSQTITVNIAGDTTPEPDEQFQVVLYGANTGLNIVGGPAIGTVLDDDGLVVRSTISIAGDTAGGEVRHTEGNTGATAYVFTVARGGGDSSAAATVDYAVTGQANALGGSDYFTTAASAADFVGGQLPTGTISFAAGQTSQTLTIEVAGDSQPEPDETFLVTLSNATGAALGSTTQAIGTIVNDDSYVYINNGDPSSPVSTYEGNGAGVAIFNLHRVGGDLLGGTVAYTVTGSGAHPADAADFAGGVFPSGSFSFAPGVGDMYVTIALQGDTLPEPDESFTITLSDSSPGMVLGAPTYPTSATHTILNDDGAIAPANTITIAGDTAGGEVRHTEGNTGLTDYVYAVTRAGDTSAAASVQYSITGAPNLIDFGTYFPTTAADAADFAGGVLPSGTIAFGAGQVTANLTIQVAGDSVVEPNETFLVSLSNPTDASLGSTTQAFGSIFNDDSYVTIANYGFPGWTTQGYEGNGASVAIFNLHRVGDDQLAGTVAYTVTGSGANPADAADFAGGVFPSGTFSFAPGVGDMYVTIALQGDSLPELDESFTLTLSDPSPGLSFDDAHPTSASYTILNDDSAISIAATDADKPEGNSGSTPFVFTVTRTAISGPDQSPAISLHWSVGGFGANPVNAADFAGGIVPSGTVSFALGQLSQTITVNIGGDTTAEVDEQFRVVLSAAPSGTTITTAQAVGTVHNDDINFAVAATTPSQHEGNSGSTPFVFTITRAGGTGTDSVGWAVVGATAHSAGPADFAPAQAMSGRVTFAPGQTSQTVTIAIAGDTLVEPDEGFQLLLQGASAGTRITTGAAQASILNDDTGFSVTPLDAVKFEGDSGATHFTFTVTRTGLLGAGDTVRWAATGGTLNPVNPADFAGGIVPTGTLTFVAGQSSAIVTVDIQGDQLIEPDETFQLALGGAHAGPGNSPASITTARADATVLNDDTGISITANTPARAEGNSGSTPFVFTVARTGTLAATDSVDWLLTGVAPNSVGPADFVSGSPLSGSLVFTPGQASKTITIDVQGDPYVEPNEQFMLLLRNASAGVTITTNHATATILNDDADPAPDIAPTPLAAADIAPAVVVFSDTRHLFAVEGNSGPTPASFSVARSGNTDIAATLSWVVLRDPRILFTPAAPSDFVGGIFPSGTISFAPGQTSQTVTFDVQGDTLAEPIENYELALYASGPDVIISGRTTFGAILNDDTSLSIAANYADVAEGSLGASTNMNFVVTRSGLNPVPCTVEWITTGIGPDSVGPNDFLGGVAPSGTLTFLAGTDSALITIQVARDSIVEPDEHFMVMLRNASTGATIIHNNAAGIIRNDDSVLAVAANTPALAEGNSGATPFVFTVTRTGALAGSVTADWLLTGVGPHSVGPNDFVGGVVPSGTVSFADGQASASITVAIQGDTYVEPDEQFRLLLRNASAGATITTNLATVTVLNDDPAPSAAIAAADGAPPASPSPPPTPTSPRATAAAPPSPSPSPAPATPPAPTASPGRSAAPAPTPSAGLISPAICCPPAPSPSPPASPARSSPSALPATSLPSPTRPSRSPSAAPAPAPSSPPAAPSAPSAPMMSATASPRSTR